ncbi:acyl-CoA dehydrogenase domain protein [Bordetella holmesii 30539]|uniref:Acyl-CoA dehydrogenase domain protein n=2 Tax=Bordetella holmesii TaxID=35814 RepID=A0ABN0RW76_9BORD|nr:acyl-CoA dehydrogenase domain protein [Bordetella holmesii ATCC 51541]AIT27200.1 acyl-CoA dehydrogenase domain protein [Bordetella holmesii 44057]EWM43684.1 acyl-CoA dehydrogenase domain protein [Bordetella holmesii 41130]EWM47783.1 acyl-CoA dehydrogenase domain protein [Bordetella holmesii 35009]EXF87241.1 acyl-CoA dehydrogenase domain protein [Bordetella holmesii 30539]EXX93246.1 acyl-CoA dehydrogenase domain protein [Bordetella holmesii 1058]KAK84951.1 hypothetical protein L503_0379 [Bo
MQPFATHQVTNQVAPLEDYSLFDTDQALKQWLVRLGIPTVELAEHGAWLGRAHTLKAGELANTHPPALHTYDPAGHRIDHVEFHPAWDALMRGA